jgi:hypothetical protein
MEQQQLDFIFQKPPQWGLRGDKGLWKHLKQAFESETPASAEVFKERLTILFRELTGDNIERGKWIYVKEYDQGGMSNGMVCGEFWLDKGFPLLINRFKELML